MSSIWVRYRSFGTSRAGCVVNRTFSRTYRDGAFCTHGTAVLPLFQVASMRHIKGAIHVQPFSASNTFNPLNRSKTPSKMRLARFDMPNSNRTECFSGFEEGFPPAKAGEPTKSP